MITQMVGTVVLALTYGAFWHQQPARGQNDDGGDHPFPLGRLVNRAFEWLLLIPHVPSPAERKASGVSEKSARPEEQTEFLRPVLREVRGWNPERRIPIERAAVEPSVPAGLFNIEGEHA